MRELTKAELREKLSKEESDTQHRHIVDDMKEWCHKTFAAKWVEKALITIFGTILLAFLSAVIALVLGSTK